MKLTSIGMPIYDPLLKAWRIVVIDLTTANMMDKKSFMLASDKFDSEGEAIAAAATIAAAFVEGKPDERTRDTID